MEPGAENVYLKQQGTGAATILGGSNFNPGEAIKYAGALKMAKEQAADKAKKDKINDLYTKLKINPSKALLEDRNEINNLDSDYMKFVSKGMTMEDGMTLQMEADARNYKQERDETDASSAKQDVALNSYVGLSRQKGNNSEAMMDNAAKFTNPELFVDDDPYINETFTPILEYYKNDPFWGATPERALLKAKTHWRNDKGRDYVSEPILNDESIVEHWQQHGLPLMSQYKNVVGKTLADGTYISEETATKLPTDTEIELSNGEKIVLPGSRTIADKFYTSDPVIEKSANNLFKKQNDTVKQDYIDQFGDDASKEYYKDFVSPIGTQVTESNTTRKPLPKEGNYRHGSQTYPFEVTLDEGTHNYNRAGQWTEENKNKTTNKITMAWASVPIRGVSFGNDKNKLPTVTVNPQRIFNQNSFSWVKDRSQYGQDLDFKVSGVYEMPATTKEINLADPEYGQFIKWAESKYGNESHTGLQKLIYVDGVKSRGLNKEIIVSADTPLSKEEAKELSKYFPDIVSSKKFAVGEVNGINETTGDKLYIQGATIPYDEVSTQVNAATKNTDWGEEINNEYGNDQNWWNDKPVIITPNKKSTNTNPATEGWNTH